MIKDMDHGDQKIAVVIPCLNEEKTIAKVVNDFRRELPDADIYVFDNNSTDNTASEAEGAGALVHHERVLGKGNVVRSIFRKVNADIYVMVDGDGTYPPERVYDLIRPIASGEADMVIGSRLHPDSVSRFRFLNRIGNRIFAFILKVVFRFKITDLLSGYRAFSRHVVKSLPILSRGFEIEAELTVKSLERRYRIVEIPVNLSQREEGAESKINIFRDGLLIFNTIFALFRDYKPLTAFGSLGLLLVIAGLIPGTMVINEVVSTGNIDQIFTAIFAAGLIFSGTIVILVGLILHTIARRFQELDYQLQNLSEYFEEK